MGRWLVISIALHAIVFLVEVRRRPAALKRAAIEVEVPRHEVAREIPREAPAIRGSGGRGSGARVAIRTRPGAATRPQLGSPMAPGSTPAGEAPGAVELFPSGVIQQFGAVAAAPPGRGVGRADEEGTSETERVGERVRGFVEEATGGQRARTLVAPQWRDFERRLVAEFRPPRKLVEEKLTVGTWARQLVEAQPRSEPLHPSREERAWTMEGNASSVLDQMAAARASYREPRKWWRAEIEVAVDAAGNVTARIITSSGKRALDRHALAAVERAAAGKLEPGAVTRWSCEAAIAVDPVPKPVLGFSFDESLGKMKVEHPIPLPEVQTRVTLIAISRRD